MAAEDNYPDCQRAFSGRKGEKHAGFQTYNEAWAFAFPGKPAPLETQTIPIPAPKTPNAEIHLGNPSRKPILNLSGQGNAPLCSDVQIYCEKFGFSRLSDDQRRAVQAVKGKYLLFAVPGSGKTTVIMARTGYLVHSCSVPAEKIMTLTFTRAAAGEMRERYRKHFSFDPENRIPAFRTIHSFCFSLVLPMLRRRGVLLPSNVVNATKCEDEKESRKYTQKAILSTVLKNNGIRKHTDETLQEILQTTISGIKNRMMQPAEFMGFFPASHRAPHLYPSHMDAVNPEAWSHRTEGLDEALACG